jgi:hypothetical protein
VAIIGPPVVIIWLFSYHLTAAAVVVVSLYLLYPKLVKYMGLLLTGEALVLGEESLYDRTFPLGRVPWTHVRGVRLKEVQDHKVVELELRNEEIFKEEFIKRTWFYRPIRRRNFENGQRSFWIDTHWVDESPGQILEAIRSRVKTTS